MKTFNELAKEIQNIVNEEVAPSNQDATRAKLMRILDQAYRYEVVDKTKDTLILKTQTSTSRVMSLSQIMEEDWNLDFEEDNIIQYVKE